MSDPNPQDLSDAPPPLPPAQTLRRKPRVFLGTFWILVTFVFLGVGFANPADAWALILLGIATFAYSIYLYRGGRFGCLFF